MMAATPVRPGRWLALDLLTVAGTAGAATLAAVARAPGVEAVYLADGPRAQVVVLRSAQVLLDIAGMGTVVDRHETVEGAVIYDQGGAPTPADPGALFVVRFPVPLEDVVAFDEWFCGEHAPRLLAGPGWVRSRLIVASGAKFTRIAVHELTSTTALDSENRRAAGQTSASQAMAARPWFAGVRRNVLSRRALP